MKKNFLAILAIGLFVFGMSGVVNAAIYSQTLDTNGNFLDGSYAINFDQNDESIKSWGHTFDTSLGVMTNGNLEIKAYDIDSWYPTIAAVFVDGTTHELGRLQGVNEGWSITTLALDDFTINAFNNRGIANFQVWEERGPIFTIDYSTLKAEYAPVPLPAAMIFFATGIVGLSFRRIKGKRK